MLSFFREKGKLLTSHGGVYTLLKKVYFRRFLSEDNKKAPPEGDAFYFYIFSTALNLPQTYHRMVENNGNRGID